MRAACIKDKGHAEPRASLTRSKRAREVLFGFSACWMGAHDLHCQWSCGLSQGSIIPKKKWFCCCTQPWDLIIPEHPPPPSDLPFNVFTSGQLFVDVVREEWGSGGSGREGATAGIKNKASLQRGRMQEVSDEFREEVSKRGGLTDGLTDKRGWGMDERGEHAIIRPPQAGLGNYSECNCRDIRELEAAMA